MTQQVNVSAKPEKKRKIASLDRRKARAGWLFVLPFILGFVLVYIPIIYESIKQNKPVDMEAFMLVANALCARGCERLVLGCTELSLLKKQGLSDELFVDSLDVLAYKTILACGKTPVGFPASFEETEVAR